jgi:uncharacterized membrane protein
MAIEDDDRASHRDPTLLSRALGAFSLGLGVAQLVRPGRLNRAIGVDDGAGPRMVMRVMGARELTHAAGLLARPHRAAWAWSRVAGDVLDLGALGRVLRSQKSARHRTLVAAASVAGVTAVDLITSRMLSRSAPHSSPEGHMEDSAAITIRTSPDDAYRRWRDLSSLPSFMNHLESVTVIDDTRSHWVARAPLGQSVEWDAEVANDVPGEVLAWQSTEADVDNSGHVTFTEAPGDQGTEVRVRITYDAPGGRLGALLAKLWGEEPRQQIKDDLFRFKQIVETGEVVRSEGSPEGASAGRQTSQRPGQPYPEEAQQGQTVGGTR